MLDAARIAVVKTLLWPEGTDAGASQIYALLDGACDAAIHARLAADTVDRRCLFRGTLPPVLARAAPYLVWLPPLAPFTDWLIAEGWGRSWGVFLRSRADLDRLRGHFRGMTRVKLEGGGTVFFRFYDPRVFRAYLPSCDTDELDYVFGPIRSFFIESADGASLESFSRQDDALARKRLAIAA